MKTNIGSGRRSWSRGRVTGLEDLQSLLSRSRDEVILRGIRKLPRGSLDYELEERTHDIEDVNSGLVVNEFVRIRQVGRL